MRRADIVMLCGLLMVGAGCSGNSGSAVASSGAGLTGVVTSDAEGPMEGVLVSAKTGTVTVTVVTDKEGRYTFPQGRLAPARYTLNTRAVGYDLAAATPVDVAAGTSVTRDLRLQTTADLPKQLMNAEWMASFPGTDDQKRFVVNCNHCHSLEITARTGHTAAGWVGVLDRMTYANGASILHPFRNPYDPEYAAHWGEYADQVPKTSLPRGSDEEGTVTVSPQRASQVCVPRIDQSQLRPSSRRLEVRAAEVPAPGR